MKEKENKKKSKGLIWIVVIIIISILTEADELYFDSDTVVGIIAVVVFIAIAVLAVKNLKKALTKKNDSAYHSHDRLSNGNTIHVESMDSFEHYKRQLDGFLEAGIVDRSEYKVLYEKYRNTLK